MKQEHITKFYEENKSSKAVTTYLLEKAMFDVQKDYLELGIMPNATLVIKSLLKVVDNKYEE